MTRHCIPVSLQWGHTLPLDFCMSQILRAGGLRLCPSLPLQKVLQAALAILPKNKRWGKEAESDSPKANIGCKIQSQYPRSFNIWTCVHSTTWSNRGWVGFTGRGVEDMFLFAGAYEGGKRYWQQWHFLMKKLCQGKKMLCASLFSHLPFCK